MDEYFDVAPDPARHQESDISGVAGTPMLNGRLNETEYLTTEPHSRLNETEYLTTEPHSRLNEAEYLTTEPQSRADRARAGTPSRDTSTVGGPMTPGAGGREEEVRVIDLQLVKRSSGLGFTVSASATGVVVHAVDESEAGVSKIRPGDKVLFVNNVDVRGWTLAAVVDLLRSSCAGPLPVTVARRGRVTQQELLDQAAEMEADGAAGADLSSLYLSAPASASETPPSRSLTPRGRPTPASPVRGQLSRTLTEWSSGRLPSAHGGHRQPAPPQRPGIGLGRVGRARGVGQVIGIVVDMDAAAVGWTLAGGEATTHGFQPVYIRAMEADTPSSRARPSLLPGDVLVAVDGRNVTDCGLLGLERLVAALGIGPVHVVVQRTTAGARGGRLGPGLGSGSGFPEVKRQPPSGAKAPWAQQVLVECDRRPLGLSVSAPLHGGTGCTVDVVQPGSAADLAGIRAGQVLLAANEDSFIGMGQVEADHVLQSLVQAAVFTIGSASVAQADLAWRPGTILEAPASAVGPAAASGPAGVPPSDRHAAVGAAPSEAQHLRLQEQQASLEREEAELERRRQELLSQQQQQQFQTSNGGGGTPLRTDGQHVSVVLTRLNGTFGMKLCDRLPSQPEVLGVFVEFAVAGGAAQAAGVQSNDRILAIEGQPLHDVDYAHAVSMITSRTTVTLALFRDDATPLSKPTTSTLDGSHSRTADTGTVDVTGLHTAPSFSTDTHCDDLPLPPSPPPPSPPTAGARTVRMGSFSMPAPPLSTVLLSEDSSAAGLAAAEDPVQLTSAVHLHLRPGSRGYGFGVHVSTPGLVLVGSVVEGGPAAEVGLLTGDQIAGINGVDVSGVEGPAMRQPDVVRQIKAQSDLHLQVIRRQPLPPQEETQPAVAEGKSAETEAGDEGLPDSSGLRPETPSELLAAIDSHLQQGQTASLEETTAEGAPQEESGAPPVQTSKPVGRTTSRKRALVRRKTPSGSSVAGGELPVNDTEGRLRNQLMAVAAEDGFFVCNTVEPELGLTEQDYETTYSITDMHAAVGSLPAFDRSAPRFIDWGSMLGITPVTEDGMVRVYDFVQAFLSTPLSVGGGPAEDLYAVPQRVEPLAEGGPSGLEETAAPARAAIVEVQEDGPYTIMDVTVHRDKRGLGFGIVGGDRDGEPINVASISSGGPAEGVLQEGDRILWANDHAIEGAGRALAVKYLKRSPEKAHMLIARGDKTHEVNAGDFHVARLMRRTNGFGVNIIGGADTSWKHVYIKKITPGGAAADTGRLAVHDRIVAISAASMVGIAHDDAVDAFRKAQPEIELLVERRTA